MRKGYGRFLLLFMITVLLGGCGFGGFSDSNTVSGSSSKATDGGTKITGVVSKGLFSQGTVQVYALNATGTQTLLKSTGIGPFGNYTARVGLSRAMVGNSYTGVVLIKAYGSYLDEATGSQLSIPSSAPLRTLLANPSGDGVFAAVTPLTELAVRKVYGSGSLSATNVGAFNQLISNLFRVDVVGTEPVNPDLSVSGFGNAATSQEQRDYTLALAGVSQLARQLGSLGEAMTTLEGAITSGGMSVQTALLFRQALSDFLLSGRNATGVSDLAQTNLGTVGGEIRSLRISTAGTLGGGSTINGVALTLELPPGVAVKGTFNPPVPIATLDGVVVPSGVATAASSYTEAVYTPASGTRPGVVRIGLINTGGMGVGEFVTVQCLLPPGTSVAPEDFAVSDLVAKDANGATLPGIGVQVPMTLQ